MNRPTVIAGNWKMNKTVEEALSFVKDLLPQITDTTSSVLLAVPYTAIYEAAKLSENTALKIGAQNMNDASPGAFTGEIAGIMLKEAGATFVLLGHSERRKLFNETDEWINKKVKRALEDQLIPILCVGETLQERNDGKTEEVLRQQLSAGLEGIDRDKIVNMMIAYEPVWAIGTGETATPDVANETQKFIRQWIEETYDVQVAEIMPLLYGGSVKHENCHTLISEPHIDGFLIGGASLSLDSFVKIVHDSAT